MTLLLLVAALVFVIVSLVESKGRNWTAWAVLMLIVMHLLGPAGVIARFP
jgi:hypothetical protein